MIPVCSTAAPSSHSPIFSHSPFFGKDVAFRPIQQLSFRIPDCLHTNSLHKYDTNDNIQLFVTNHSTQTNDNACLLFTQNQLQIAALDSTSNSLDASLTTLKTSVDSLQSLATSFLDKGDRFFDTTTAAITSQLKQTIQSVEDAINNLVNGLSSNADQSVELAGTRLAALSLHLRDTISKVGAVSVDLLRQTIVILEYYLATALKFIPYYYDNAKDLFPPPVRDVLNLTQAKVTEILDPVATVFKQVYIVIEALERSLGFDPNDPIVPFIFFIGTSATLGTFYWASVYGGYSGDLSPQSTLDMLTGENDVVLVDIRPEGLRERDGVPDLRRGARFKYASISLPEIDGSVRKLMKKERDLDDTLVAAVIRNLKIVKDRSRVIVLDVDGTRAKSIARSLRKLGLKKPYLVQGGFQSWVKGGMRIKELKAETAFTVLNEEAEAILEDIKPTPLKAVGYGVGFIAASYALSEWEKTLQFVGVIGLGQTIYQRLASYENSEDFKQDVRMLMSPFRVGTMAFSWAAGKLEPNRIGLPTSPSSSDVQSRVLQAAAKHESQPSDSEESSQEFPVAAATENTVTNE